jgi:hypothetical protein
MGCYVVRVWVLYALCGRMVGPLGRVEDRKGLFDEREERFLDEWKRGRFPDLGVKDYNDKWISVFFYLISFNFNFILILLVFLRRVTAIFTAYIIFAWG